MKKVALAILCLLAVALNPSMVSAAGVSVIDGFKISTKEELHEKLAKDLNFPTYYGNNLDALFEVLVSEKESTVVKVLNVDVLKKKIGKKYVEGFLSAVSDASDENPRVVLIFAAKM